MSKDFRQFWAGMFGISNDLICDLHNGTELTMDLGDPQSADRQKFFLEYIWKVMADETRVYLLVAHGGIFRFIRSYFENLTNEEFARSLIANCKVLRMGDPAPDKPLEHSLTWEVTDEMTAKRIGSAGSKILSTPNMVALMEACALELAKEYLSEGQTTVGAEVSCRHLAPTPVGMKVTATAKLKKTEGRKMWFDIEVHDEKGLCGKGSHLRVKVNSKAMKDKGAAKAKA